MDTKYQIFISSTFTDLKEERRVVTEQILKLRHIPVGMELFQAANTSQWEYIKRRISQCDYYLVVVAERYGSQAAGGKSYTQLEYEYAVEQGVPVIAFLLSQDARKSWPKEKCEFDKASEIESFRGLCQQKMVMYWGSSLELGGAVATSLLELIEDEPRVGWVRADTVASSVALNEIAVLSEERRRLQAKLTDLESAASVPPIVNARKKILDENMVDYEIWSGGTIVKTGCISVLAIFMACYKKLASRVQAHAFEEVVTEALGLGSRLSMDYYRVAEELSSHDLIEILSVPNGYTTGYHSAYILSSFGKAFTLHIQMQEAPAQAQT